DKRGVVFDATYDNLNRPLTKTVAESITNGGTPLTAAAYVYNDHAAAVTESDANGNLTTSYLDGLHRVRLIDDPDPNAAFDPSGSDPFPTGIVTNQYDGVNLRVTVDKKGQRREYDYDLLNRLVQIREFDQTGTLRTTLGFAWLDAENKIRATDRRGVHTTQQLDALGRLVQRRRSGLDMAAFYGTGEVLLGTFEYDGNSNVMRMTQPKGAGVTTAYRYDELNRLLVVDESPRADANTAAGVTRYFYDGNRNRIAQQDPAGNLTTYRYDALNRLTDVFHHTTLGALGDGTTRGADPRGSALYGGGAGGDESTALHWQQAYDLNGNVRLIEDAQGQQID